ncbi:hypothetical protein ACQKJG_18330 [Priestia megaterium]|uniref:hypothetical protein n=1 Tax=Priestia megaterium TaxID=1404 RepID=UPI003CFECDFC
MEKTIEMFDLTSLKAEFISIYLVAHPECLEIGVMHDTTARALPKMPVKNCNVTVPAHIKIDSSANKLYIYGVNIVTLEQFIDAAEKAGCNNPYTISLDEYLEFYTYSPHRRILLHEVQLIVKQAYHARPDSRGGAGRFTRAFIEFCKEYNSKIDESAETIR